MMNLISVSSPKPLNITNTNNNIRATKKKHNEKSVNCTSIKKEAILSGLVNGALSLTLLLSSPSIAIDSPSPSPSYCGDEERDFEMVTNKELFTNESLVEEAWQIVNDAFLHTGRALWSPHSWLDKKKDILSSSFKSRSKAHNFVRKMLGSLGDPYTRFLSPEEFSKMARYDMTGIGVNIKQMPDNNGSFKLKVLGLILDGPAHSAGIRQGDEVLSVDGEDVRGNSAFEVSSKLQGPSETFVTVEVKHGNCGPVQSFKIQRQMVAKPPVFYRLEQIDNGATSVGYVRLKEFNALARKDVVTAMKRLQDLGASCFVLDLRDNFGGLVEAGIEIAKLFLDKGDTVIYTAGRGQSQNAIVTESTPLVTVPVMVLVNHNTASASEIVASALHDNCKAVLVGEKTFGKGLIQSVFELHDGSGVVVTIGKYVTPGHVDINGNGIEPDFSNIPRWSEVAKYLSSCNLLRQR